VTTLALVGLTAVFLTGFAMGSIFERLVGLAIDDGDGGEA